MEIFEGHRTLFRPLARPAITIGNFDGVHLGHQALLAATRQAAEHRGGDAVVLTFEPHPATALGGSFMPRLTSPERKSELLAQSDMDVAIIEPFDLAFSTVSAHAFAHEILAKIFQAKHILVGPNFRYGQGRNGTIDTLRAAGRTLGFFVEEVKATEVGGLAVSSTRVREALKASDISLANELLGRSYDVDGNVIKGAGRGQTIGVPTANLDVDGVLLPGGGVYATWIEVLNSQRRYMGATNVGTNPTFTNQGASTVESHLLDFKGDLYGQRLRISFVQRLRSEMRFSDVPSLVAQIQSDKERARQILSTSPNQPQGLPT